MRVSKRKSKKKRSPALDITRPPIRAAKDFTEHSNIGQGFLCAAEWMRVCEGTALILEEVGSCYTSPEGVDHGFARLRYMGASQTANRKKTYIDMTSPAKGKYSVKISAYPPQAEALFIGLRNANGRGVNPKYREASEALRIAFHEEIKAALLRPGMFPRNEDGSLPRVDLSDEYP